MRHARKLRRIALFVTGWIAFLVVGAACNTTRPTATPIPTRAVTPLPTGGFTPAPTLLPPVNLNPTDVDSRVTVRFVNGIPRAFDVQIEGSLVASSLPFAAPTEPIYLDPGTYRLRIVPAGAGLSVAKVLIDQPITLKASSSVALVLTGTPDRIRLYEAQNNTRQLAAGQARFTFAQFLPAAAPLTVSAGDKALASVSGEGATVEALVDAAPLTLNFQQAGGAQFNQPLTLTEQTAYLVVVVGEAASARAAIIPEFAVRETRLRVVHAAVGAATKQKVDVFLDSRLVADNLDFGAATEWQALPARTYRLRVVRAEDRADAKPLYTSQFELAPNRTNNLILLDSADSFDFRLVPEDLTQLDADFARLVLVNVARGSTNLQLVRSGVLDASIRPLGYGESSPAIVLRVGSAEVTFRATIFNQGTALPQQVIEAKPAFALKPGTAYLYLVTGSSRDTLPFLLSTEVGARAKPTPTATPNTAMRVRFINGLADGTAVNLALNGSQLFSQLEAAKGSAMQVVPVQIGTLALLDGTGKSITSGEFTQAPGRGLLLIAVGSAAQPRLLQAIQYSRPTGNTGIMQVIHAALGRNTLRVEFALSVATPGGSSTDRATGTPAFAGLRPVELVGRLDYANISAESSFTPGTYDFTIRDANTNAIFGELRATVIETGKRYDILVLPGAPGQVNPLLFTTDDKPE